MPRQRLDPDHQDAVFVGVKLGHSNAVRLAEVARRDGVGKSAFVRALILRALERADTAPPDERAA